MATTETNSHQPAIVVPEAVAAAPTALAAPAAAPAAAAAAAPVPLTAVPNAPAEAVDTRVKRKYTRRSKTAVLEAAPRRGRPPGSKNKAKGEVAAAAPKRGRPPGSKNKAKAEAAAPATEPKRRGRPPKVQAAPKVKAIKAPKAPKAAKVSKTAGVKAQGQVPVLVMKALEAAAKDAGIKVGKQIGEILTKWAVKQGVVLAS